MTNACLLLKVLCLLATLTTLCLSKPMEINEAVDLREGDVIAFRFRTFNPSNIGWLVFAVQDMAGPVDMNLFKIILEQKKLVIGMNDYDGTGANDVSRLRRVNENNADPEHWCEYHVRVFHDRYEVYMQYQPVVISKYDDMELMGKFSYKNATRLTALYDDDLVELGYMKKGSAAATNYFWFPSHIISNDMSVQVEIGQTLFLELFVGNRTWFYWNKQEPRDGKALLRFYNHNNMTLLQFKLDINKGLQMTEPNVTDCGQFSIDENTILKIFVEVYDDKFVIYTDNNRIWNPKRTNCTVIHSSDPNDLKGFAIKGDVEPFRYSLLERNDTTPKRETKPVIQRFALFGDYNDTVSR